MDESSNVMGIEKFFPGTGTFISFFLIIHETDCSEFFYPKMDNPSVLYLTRDGGCVWDIF
jgi:hypothetical protein